MVTVDARTSKSKMSSEDDDSLGAITITQLLVPRTNKSDDEVSWRLDTEMNHEQYVGGRISYYSDGDFRPQNSELEVVKLGLQTPSKTSSGHGCGADISRSFLLAVLDG